MSIRKTVTVRQASALTGFTPAHIYRLIRSGQWIAIKGDGPHSKHHIVEDSIAAWFDQQLKDAAIPAAPVLDADRELPPVDHPAFS